MGEREKIRVLLSTLGPLHLMKSAEFLSPLVDIRVVQGWLPSWWNRWMLTVAGKIVGRDLHKPFRKRTPACLAGRNTGIGSAEFFLWACKLFHLQGEMRSSYNAARLYGWRSRRLIRDADIFHVRSGSGFGGAVERARERGMKIVVDHSIAHPAYMDKQLRAEYDRYGMTFALGMDNPFWAHIVEECGKADCVLVNSQFVKDTFVENGFDADKIAVVLLGVRSDFFSLKKSYALEGDTINILFTGGFNFRKGCEYILRALKELEEEGVGYTMTVVGDWRGSQPLIERYSPRHLRTVMTVPQDELKSFLASADVYLFPSLCEGCASSGMEALAAGLPVIATAESGLPIEHMSNGMIIPSKDVEAIVSAVKTLKGDGALRERLGVAAARTIREKYTWEKYAANVVEIYKRLLGR